MYTDILLKAIANIVVYLDIWVLIMEFDISFKLFKAMIIECFCCCDFFFSISVYHIIIRIYALYASCVHNSNW